MPALPCPKGGRRMFYISAKEYDYYVDALVADGVVAEGFATRREAERMVKRLDHRFFIDHDHTLCGIEYAIHEGDPNAYVGALDTTAPHDGAQGVPPPAAIVTNAATLASAAAALLAHRKQGRLHPIDFQRLAAALAKEEKEHAR